MKGVCLENMLEIVFQRSKCKSKEASRAYSFGKNKYFLFFIDDFSRKTLGIFFERKI